VLVGEIFCTDLTKGNPFLNQEILQWLAICLPDGKGINKVQYRTVQYSTYRTVGKVPTYLHNRTDLVCFLDPEFLLPRHRLLRHIWFRRSVWYPTFGPKIYWNYVFSLQFDLNFFNAICSLQLQVPIFRKIKIKKVFPFNLCLIFDEKSWENYRAAVPTVKGLHSYSWRRETPIFWDKNLNSERVFIFYNLLKIYRKQRSNIIVLWHNFVVMVHEFCDIIL